jgi:hypothetical protein
VDGRQYTIIVRGELSERFAAAFPGASIEAGDGQTGLMTELFDQSQLHGLLDRLRNFGLELISIQETAPDPPAPEERTSCR